LIAILRALTLSSCLIYVINLELLPLLACRRRLLAH